MKRKVFLVEDHPIMRTGYVALVEREPDLVLCGEAGEVAEALEKIPEAAPDLVVIDLSLQAGSGIELIRHLKVRFPDLPTLVISAHDETLYAEQVLREGSRGYVMKHEAPRTVIEAIRQVLAGQLYLSQRMRDRFLSLHVGSAAEAAPLERLSNRELEVFEYLGRGLTTREIAAALQISPKTVETYRSNIKSKLGLDSASELMQRAVLWIEGVDGR